MKLYIITSSSCSHCDHLKDLLKNGLKDKIKDKFPELKIKKYDDEIPEKLSNYADAWKPMLVLMNENRIISIYNAKLGDNFSQDNYRSKYDARDSKSYIKWLDRKINKKDKLTSKKKRKD